MMKDLYSFHTSEKDLMSFYNQVAQAYKNIFSRCGLKTYYTLAAGGDFTAENTHEFQVPAEVGEDTIYACQKCDYAENKEVSKLTEGEQCPECGGEIRKLKAIEVGNIFPLGTRYSKPVGLQFTDQDGTRKDVVMGSYGIGLGRLMATVVEVGHDDKGIIWPKALSPFDIQIVVLGEDRALMERARKLADNFSQEGLAVLLDDRDLSAGEKLSDRELIGIHLCVVVSSKGEADSTVEFYNRQNQESHRIKLAEVLAYVKNS